MNKKEKKSFQVEIASNIIMPGSLTDLLVVLGSTLVNCNSLDQVKYVATNTNLKTKMLAVENPN
jgi:hypothetical protein